MVSAGDANSLLAHLPIELLWVAESHRGRGLGSRLPAAVEEEARDRGLRDDRSRFAFFQASNLYLDRGYVAIGTTTDTPRGITQTLLQKAL